MHQVSDGLTGYQKQMVERALTLIVQERVVQFAKKLQQKKKAKQNVKYSSRKCTQLMCLTEQIMKFTS